MKFYGRLSPGITTSLETPIELILNLPHKASGVVVKIWERAEFVNIDGKLVKESGGDDLLLELHGNIEKDAPQRKRGRSKFVVSHVVNPPRDVKAPLHTIGIKVEGADDLFEATIPSTDAEMIGQNFEISLSIEHGGSEVFRSNVSTFIRPALATPCVVAKRVVEYDPDGKPIFDDVETEPAYLAGHFVTLGKATSDTDDGQLAVTGFAVIDESGRLLPCDSQGSPVPGEVVSLRTHKDLFAYITRELPDAAKTVGDTSISLRLCYPIEADGRIEYDVPDTGQLFEFTFMAGDAGGAA